MQGQSPSSALPPEPASAAAAMPAAMPAATPAGTARTHGADRISDEVYLTGHSVALVLLVVAVVLIVVGRGPRRRDALLDAHAQESTPEAASVVTSRADA
jgi:hypothetical protein